MIEIEAKIKVNSREDILATIKHLTKISENHVLDIYYDKNDELKSTDKVLRLRKQNDTTYIAYKGPRTEDNNLIIREENETKIGSFEVAKKIIESLGYCPTQVTEKIRETFKIENDDTKIELDHYPFIGHYLEIEGAKERVLTIMNELGYSMASAVTKNCSELFYEYLASEDIELDNPNLQFTFKDANMISLSN